MADDTPSAAPGTESTPSADPANKPLFKPKLSPTTYKALQRCNRYAFYSRLHRLEKQTPGMALGDEVHTLAEQYLRDGVEPPNSPVGRLFRPGLKLLPLPGTVHVETKVNLPCGPVDFTGRVDLHPKDPDRYLIGDHKTSSDPEKWGLTSEALAEDSAMLGYAKGLYNEKQPAEVAFDHYYYATKGAPRAFRVSAAASWEAVEANWTRMLKSGILLYDIWNATKDLTVDEGALLVAADATGCSAYGGCPFRDRCPAVVTGARAFFDVNRIMQTEGKMTDAQTPALTPEERVKALHARIAARNGGVVPKPTKPVVDATVAGPDPTPAKVVVVAEPPPFTGIALPGEVAAEAREAGIADDRAAVGVLATKRGLAFDEVWNLLHPPEVVPAEAPVKVEVEVPTKDAAVSPEADKPKPKKPAGNPDEKYAQLLATCQAQANGIIGDEVAFVKAINKQFGIFQRLRKEAIDYVIQAMWPKGGFPPPSAQAGEPVSDPAATSQTSAQTSVAEVPDGSGTSGTSVTAPVSGRVDRAVEAAHIMHDLDAFNTAHHSASSSTQRDRWADRTDCKYLPAAFKGIEEHSRRLGDRDAADMAAALSERIAAFGAQFGWPTKSSEAAPGVDFTKVDKAAAITGPPETTPEEAAAAVAEVEAPAPSPAPTMHSPDVDLARAMAAAVAEAEGVFAADPEVVTVPLFAAPLPAGRSLTAGTEGGASLALVREQTAEEKSKRALQSAQKDAEMLVHPVLGHARRCSRAAVKVLVLVDATLQGLPGGCTLDVLCVPACRKVEVDKKVPYYALPAYSDGQKAVAAIMIQALAKAEDEVLAPAAVKSRDLTDTVYSQVNVPLAAYCIYVSTKSPLYNDMLPILAALPGAVVITGRP